MTWNEIGVGIAANSAVDFCEQITQAEEFGIPTAWATIGGAGGGDPLTALGAALSQTEKIAGGTAIIPTWPRHPLAIAQQAVALEELAPGRLRLGLGPSHKPMMTRSIGAQWNKPLTHLKEYLTSLRLLFTNGTVDFQGEQVTLRTSIKAPINVDILASALRKKSFSLCGELTDGAISWMCPKTYLIDQALPALNQGAEQANRDKIIPLIAHVPIAVSSDRSVARRLAQEQLARYSEIPFYQAMFLDAGFEISGNPYPDELLDDLVISGTEKEVAEKLVSYLDAGCGEVLAAPLINTADRASSITESFSAIALANKRSISPSVAKQD